LSFPLISFISPRGDEVSRKLFSTQIEDDPPFLFPASQPQMVQLWESGLYDFNLDELSIGKDDTDIAPVLGKSSLRKSGLGVKKERSKSEENPNRGRTKTLIGLDKERQIAYYIFFNKSKDFQSSGVVLDSYGKDAD